jgi:hypothetical protein
MSADRYRGLQLQIEGQAESIRELEADIAAKVEEIRLVTQLCETRTVELAESTEAHGRTKAQLHGVERDLDGTKSKLQVDAMNDMYLQHSWSYVVFRSRDWTWQRKNSS